MVRPNFTGVERSDDVVRVSGASDDVEEIVDIQVILTQDDRVARKAVGKVGSQWDVEFPAATFVAGSAVAFGVETRSQNFTTITWAQAVEIP